MAVQKIIIAKVAGSGGKHVTALLRRWAKRPPKLNQIDRLIARLRQHCTDLPVIYFSEHLDMWTVCPLEFWRDCVPNFKVLRIEPYGIMMLWHQVPDTRSLKRAILRARKRLKPRQPSFQEQRMFYDRVIEAIEAWELPHQRRCNCCF